MDELIILLWEMPQLVRPPIIVSFATAMSDTWLNLGGDG